MMGDFEYRNGVVDPWDLDVVRNSVSLLQSLGRLDQALALDEAVVRLDWLT